MLAILKLVADVKERIEADADMSDHEYRLVRELLDAHTARLDDLTGRIALLEVKAAEQEKQLAAYRALTEGLQRQATAARATADELQRRLDVTQRGLSDITARVRRPGCGTGRAWRGSECVDVGANPR